MVVARTARGIAAGVRSRAGVAAAVAVAVALFDLLAPVVLLSLAKKPADFFTWNPWLRRLPEYLGSGDAKLAVLAQLRIAWFAAGDDWVFVLDVPTLALIACTAVVFGVWFALWSSRRAGLVGAIGSLLGLTTCPCTLAFAGAPAASLAAIATLSRAGTAIVLAGMIAGILWSGFSAGRPSPDPAADRPSRAAG